MNKGWYYVQCCHGGRGISYSWSPLLPWRDVWTQAKEWFRVLCCLLPFALILRLLVGSQQQVFTRSALLKLSVPQLCVQAREQPRMLFFIFYQETGSLSFTASSVRIAGPWDSEDSTVSVSHPTIGAQELHIHATMTGYSWVLGFQT